MPTTSASCVDGASARLATIAVQRLCSIRPSGRNISVVSSSTQRCGIGRVCDLHVPHRRQVDARCRRATRGRAPPPAGCRPSHAVAAQIRRATTSPPHPRTPRSTASARRRAAASRGSSLVRSDRAETRTRRRRRSRAASSRPTPPTARRSCRRSSTPSPARRRASGGAARGAPSHRPRPAPRPRAPPARSPADPRSGSPACTRTPPRRIGTSVSANSVERVEAVVVGPHPEPHDRPPAGGAGRRRGPGRPRATLSSVIRHPAVDGSLDQLRGLHRTVHRDRLRRHARPQRRLELSRTERVASGPLVGEDPTDAPA